MQVMLPSDNTCRINLRSSTFIAVKKAEAELKAGAFSTAKNVELRRF